MGDWGADFSVPESVQVVGNTVYLADGRGLHILDVSDPANVRQLGGLDASGYASAVQVVSNIACVADGDGLEVLDVSDPGDPRPLGGFATSGSARTVHVLENRAYVADGFLQVPDIRDPAKIRRLGGTVGTNGVAFALQVVGNLAYLADGNAGLQVWDVSDPANMRWLGGSAESRGAMAVQVVGQRAFVAAWNEGLQVWDVSDSPNMRRLGNFNSRARDVQVVGSLAYLADYYDGLQVLDVSDPASIRRLGGRSTPYPGNGKPGDLKVFGKLVYLPYGPDGLEVWDVSDPANVRQLGGFDTPGDAMAVDVVGDLAFVADGTAGLQVIKLYGGPGFAPGILAEPQSGRLSLGSTVTLRVSAAGTAPLRYQWRRDGVDLMDNGRRSGSTTAQLSINQLEAADFGTYSVVVSNQAGTVTSAPATLSLGDRFQVLLSWSDLRPDQGQLVSRISGAPAGATVILSSSVDLVNWVPWLTNVAPTGALEAQVLWTNAAPHRFFRAIHR